MPRYKFVHELEVQFDAADQHSADANAALLHAQVVALLRPRFTSLETHGTARATEITGE